MNMGKYWKNKSMVLDVKAYKQGGKRNAKRNVDLFALVSNTVFIMSMKTE